MDTIKVTNSVGETIIELMPTPRKNLAELERLLIEIQAAWLRCKFSVGKVCADDAAWEQMKQAIALLPIKDCPDGTWTKLDEISSDYAQIERLFFAKKCNVMEENGTIEIFDFTEFVGSEICWIHRFNCDEILTQASQFNTAMVEPENVKAK